MPGRPHIVRGIGASPGVAMGRVYLLDRRKVRVRRYHIHPEQVESEIERLRSAIARSVEQLETIRGRFVGDGRDHQAILEGHEMMLRDQALITESADLIRQELINAEWAISRVIARICALFVRVANSYFRGQSARFEQFQTRAPKFSGS